MDATKIVIIALAGYIGYKLLQPHTAAGTTSVPGHASIAIGEPYGSGGGGGDITDGKTGGADQTLLVNWLRPYDPNTDFMLSDDPWGTSYRQQYPYKPGVVDVSQYSN